VIYNWNVVRCDVVLKEMHTARHALPQESAITQHLAAVGLVSPSHPATLVELGAGTGGLSKRVQRFAPGTPTVLVERDTMKRRHDMYVKKSDLVSNNATLSNIFSLPPLCTRKVYVRKKKFNVKKVELFFWLNLIITMIMNICRHG